MAKPVAVRVVSNPESKVKSFHYLFENTMKDKIQSADFWPENVLIKTFRLNDEAREWLKKLRRVDRADTAWLNNAMNISLFNARLIKNKIDRFHAYLMLHCPDAFAVTETWLTHDDDDFIGPQCCPEEYKFISCSREDIRGGGDDFSLFFLKPALNSTYITTNSCIRSYIGFDYFNLYSCEFFCWWWNCKRPQLH